MKKLVIALLVLLTLVSGCSKPAEPEPQPEPEPEPIGYYGPYYICSKTEIAPEDLKDKKIALQEYYGSEYNAYVMEYLSQYGVTEDNIVYLDSYKAVPDVIAADSADCWIMDPEVEQLVHDFRSDYEIDGYKKIVEINVPYYEETELPKEITSDPLYNEPFIVMCTGIDENVDPDTTRGVRTDVNIVMVVDPNRNHVLTVSFPRDTYMRSYNHGYYTKMNAIVQNGMDDLLDSVGDTLDCEIEHFAQESFKSFVIMMNYIGGAWVDVPMNVHMDQDSYRNVKQPYDIPKGETLLYGEPALALCRNRKYNGIAGGDFGRIRNQALVVNSLIEKVAKNPKIIDLVGFDWLYPYMIHTDFTPEQMQVLFQVAREFSEGYTVDNFFIECTDGSTESGSYIARPIRRYINIAKGKIQLALTGKIDEDADYYDEILTGYITGGAGAYKDGGYIGEEYDLREVYGIEKKKEEEETPSEETPAEEGEKESGETSGN